MKKFRRQMKTVLSAVSIVVLMIVSAMLLYSSVAASLKACGIIKTNEEFSSLETENKNVGQYEVYRMPDAEDTEYTLVELAEPSDALSEPAEALPDEEEHDETADLLREGYGAACIARAHPRACRGRQGRARHYIAVQGVRD